MDYTNERIQQWHEEGIELAHLWKRCEHRMVELLGFMHVSKGYYLYDCASLREYAIERWSLPPAAASDLVTVAKKSCEIPEMLEALKANKATVSKLRKVCPVINEEEKVDWLLLVEKASTRDIEKVVAIERPGAALVAPMHYLTDTLVNLNAAIPGSLAKDLERIQDLIAQKEQRNVNFVEALQAMATIVLDKLDPVRKAERAESRKTSGLSPKKAVDPNIEATKNQPPSGCRTKVATAIEHARNLRDRGQCTVIAANGKRCPNKRWTEGHHIIEVANGGSNDVSNLATVCEEHHRAIHHPLWNTEIQFTTLASRTDFTQNEFVT